MSYRQKPFLTLAAAAALALLLAGCGGGSSTTTDPVDPGPTPDQMEAMALSAAQTAAATAATNAQTAADMAAADVAAITDLDGEDHERVAAAQSVAADAQAAADRAKTASDNAAAATTSAAAVAFQTTAEAEATTAANLRMSVANLLTAAQNARDERVAQAMTDAITKVAESKEKAIAAEAAQTTDDGLGGEDATTDYGINIKRDRTSTTITFDNGADPAVDLDPEFEQAMDLGGGTTMHVREMEADDDGNVEDEVVVVTTDIEMPKATPFADVTGQDLNARDLDDTVDADEDGNATNDFTALTVDGTSADVRALVMSSEFSASRAATLNFTGDTAGTDADEAEEVAGTYNGAMGTYRCNDAGGCTVVLGDTDSDMDGMQLGITAMTNWVFTPAEGATSDVPDADYLHYGFWLKRTKDSDGNVTSYDEVETFAGSSVTASTAVADVDGTASYLGGATGVYVHTVSNSNGSRAQATSGHFTADASLEATFGQVAVSDTDTRGTIAENLLNTLTGTINNFDLSGGEDQQWSVTLDGTIATNAATGTAKGGGMGDGSFSASFYGPSGEVDHDNDGNTPTVNTAPHTIIGEFNSNFTNGSVAGAFGAREDD